MDAGSQAASTAAAPARVRDQPDAIVVPDRRGARRLASGMIAYVTSERDYVRLHVGARSWLVRSTMASAEARLAPLGFERIHRGVLINAARVHGRYRRADGAPMVVLESGEEFSVGRKYAKSLRAGRCARSS